MEEVDRVEATCFLRYLFVKLSVERDRHFSLRLLSRCSNVYTRRPLFFFFLFLFSIIIERKERERKERKMK